VTSCISWQSSRRIGKVGSELLWATNPVGHALSVEVPAARVSIEPATQITDGAETFRTLGKAVGEKGIGGSDGTRTRGLLRDRQAF